jgi:hypothetical protein
MVNPVSSSAIADTLVRAYTRTLCVTNQPAHWFAVVPRAGGNRPRSKAPHPYDRSCMSRIWPYPAAQDVEALGSVQLTNATTLPPGPRPFLPLMVCYSQGPEKNA